MPPPAAEPRTIACTVLRISMRWSDQRVWFDLSRLVTRHFHSDTVFANYWLCPFHGHSPYPVVWTMLPKTSWSCSRGINYIGLTPVSNGKSPTRLGTPSATRGAFRPATGADVP